MWTFFNFSSLYAFYDDNLNPHNVNVTAGAERQFVLVQIYVRCLSGLGIHIERKFCEVSLNSHIEILETSFYAQPTQNFSQLYYKGQRLIVFELQKMKASSVVLLLVLGGVIGCPPKAELNGM